jgi:HNH endonuclease
MERQNTYALRSAGFEQAEACELCGSTENLVIDHIIALSQGGTNELSNLRTLCQSCNTKQGWQNRERPEVVKYTTHLTPGMIEDIKTFAFKYKLKDYQVVQVAIKEFLERQKEQGS